MLLKICKCSILRDKYFVASLLFSFISVDIFSSLVRLLPSNAAGLTSSKVFADILFNSFMLYFWTSYTDLAFGEKLILVNHIYG